jgi:dTDP-4-dehydrorhamnose 3,5-epimerase
VCYPEHEPGFNNVIINDFNNIEGIEVNKVAYFSDLRGIFIKFEPKKFIDTRFTTVATSINPLVGTIRGIHLQVEPYAEEKIVTCIQGSTFEVIIDLRPNSRSFGKIATFELSQENRLQVYLPKGIAHGFQTLTPQTIVQYCLTSQYSPEFSYSIDPFGDVEIAWPLKEVSISEKDVRGVSVSFAAQKYAESLLR